MAKGTVRSPMTPYLQQKDKRTPSTAGTSEMMPDARIKQATDVQSPQTPFRINPNAGRKKS